jgi:hemolysin III
MHRFREPVSGFTHFIGAVLALVGLIWLVYLTRHDLTKMLTVSVFGVSMVLVYAASTAMHLYNGSEQAISRLTRLDHASIYLVIAGTYTPFCYNLLTGEWRVGILVVIWILALVGAASKLLWYWDGHLSTLLYVVMGWVGVIALPQIETMIDPGLIILVLGGGIIYSIGAVIFSLERPNLHRHFGFHELWHIFVMAGSAFHFAAVIFYVV